MSNLPHSYQIYVDMMDEMRTRIHALRDVLRAKESWSPIILQEHAYLQLRIMCEQIALGCLIAHGDIESRGALKEWRIVKVMKTMEKLKPNFFPRGVRFKSGDGTLNFDDYNVPKLNKSELMNLWVRAGSFLHKGNAEDILARKSYNPTVDITEIAGWGQKILNLMEQHVISSADNKSHLLVALASEDSGGNAALWVASSP